MAAANIDMAYRDFCAHILIKLNECRCAALEPSRQQSGTSQAGLRCSDAAWAAESPAAGSKHARVPTQAADSAPAGAAPQGPPLTRSLSHFRWLLIPLPPSLLPAAVPACTCPGSASTSGTSTKSASTRRASCAVDVQAPPRWAQPRRFSVGMPASPVTTAGLSSLALLLLLQDYKRRVQLAQQEAST